MSIKQVGKHTEWFFVAVLTFYASLSSAVTLDENCVVSILNRTVQVSIDGGWSMPNVPSQMGRVRARATCDHNGQTISGQSEYFTIVNNGITRTSEIIFEDITPIPVSLIYTISSDTVLDSIGVTSQVAVVATYPDENIQDVTMALSGINYNSTNPTIATVSEDGLVTAVSSGTILLTARKDGVIAVKRFTISSTGDTDGDGLPDDFELANGLNPNDAIDANEDQDNDGLSALEEFNLGTNINVADTDGDGITDGEEIVAGNDGFETDPLNADTDGDGLNDYLEILAGSSPTDASDTNFAGALESIKVTPSNIALTFNSIKSEESTQLTVTGILVDGSTVNLTRKSTGTTYTTSDISIVSFGLTDGEIFAGQEGSTKVTIANNGISIDVSVNVDTFAPVALSTISIPGHANNVDVSGDYAFIAAGNSGLQVVDVSDKHNPNIVANLDTLGSANDIRIVSNIAYIADGNNGLVLIDISDPQNPILISSYDTTGNANDIVVFKNRAYVADGSAGLQIIDVFNPFSPVLLKTVKTQGAAVGVAVSDELAVVAVGTVGIQVIDIVNPNSAIVVGVVDTGDARDVELDGNYVLVADYENSLTSVDLSDPAIPVILDNTTLNNGGRLVDVALSAGFSFGADVFFVNGVPITDTSVPESLVSRQILDFRSMRDDNGTGIAVDSSYVYLTAEKGSDTRLYIGQFLSLSDNAGIAPEIILDSPNEGDTVIEGATLPITVSATDDYAVVAVNIFVDGVKVATDTSEPYQVNILVPDNAAVFNIEAEAIDLAGNSSNVGISLNIIPDPLTTVIGKVVQLDGSVAVDADIECQQVTTTTLNDGTFKISNLPTIYGAIKCTASLVNNDGKELLNLSSAVYPVLAGITDVGEIILDKAKIFPSYLYRVFGGTTSYVTKEEAVNGGRFYISPIVRSIYGSGRTAFVAKLNEHITGNDMKVTLRVKAPMSEGVIQARDFGISLYNTDVAGEYASVMLMGDAWGRPWSSLHAFGSNVRPFSGYLVDMEDWHIAEFIIKNGRASVKYDGLETGFLNYTEGSYSINGLTISFKGSASIDWISITQGDAEIWREDFNE